MQNQLMWLLRQFLVGDVSISYLSCLLLLLSEKEDCIGGIPTTPLRCLSECIVLRVNAQNNVRKIDQPVP
jgi:hypothetical protein